MVENECSIGREARTGPPRPPFNLLLLAGEEDTWTRAVQNAASSIGAVALYETHSVNEAMSRLVLGDPDFSHLLVNSDFVGNRIGELAKLTAGEAHNQTVLVMLGDQGEIPPRSAVVHDADLGSLTRAIVSDAAFARPNFAPLALEELEAALAGAQLHTRYQPIVRLADHQPVGLEVLARLDHPFYGTLPPVHFVSQMENAGLSTQLTQAVVTRAFVDYAQHLAGMGLWIALNFPLDVLMDDQALLWLEHRRIDAGIAAERIMIELTESRPVDALDVPGLESLRASITRLRRLGYSLAIDDLGPAMVNHEALFELAFTSVKLDKGVVAASSYDPHAQAFLTDAIAMARKTGFSIVAEGVKDDVTWDRMRRAGADHAQGYLVARPLPAAAVPVWLQAWQGRSH